jgi:peptide-methionine (S)-S-oxide reductase
MAWFPPRRPRPRGNGSSVFRALSILLSLALGAAIPQTGSAAERAVLAPAAVRQANESAGLKTAIFAGGCFWGIEGVFSHVQGVTSAVSGYHGGTRARANYTDVSAGRTGHAEAVRVTYDPARVRYDQLLRIFFSVGADPTLLNRQGPDVGLQYRSALAPVSEEQRLVASAYLAQLGASRIWKDPIVTRIEPQLRFYPAEDDHQDFMASNPRHPYILAWDVAKIEALKRLLPAHYKAAFTPG